MRTLCLLITISISAFLFPITTSGQSTYTWNGTTGNWNEATNWTPNGTPGEVDTAIINTDGDYTVTLNIDTTVAKIILGGESGSQTLSMANRIINIVEDLEIGSNGILSVTSTTLTGYGSLLNSGNFTSTALTLNMEFENEGTATFYGTTNLNDTLITHINSSIAISSYTGYVIYFTSAKGFVNNGTFRSLTYNYWGGGFLEVTDGTLTNSSNGSIEILAPGTLSSSSSAFSVKTELENQGTFTVSHKSFLDKQDAIHQNSGTFSITKSNLTVTQAGTISAFENSGTISVDSESSLTINGGTFTHNSGDLEVSGLFAISNCIVNIIPEFSNTYNLSLTGCTLNCTSTFSNQEALSMANTTVNGSEFFTNLDTIVAQGVVMNMGFDNHAQATFSGETDFNDTLIIQNNSTLRIASYSNIPIQFTLNNSLTNNGQLEFLTYNYWGGGFFNITDGVLLNTESGIIRVLTSGTLSSSSTAFTLDVQLDNHGEIILDRHTYLDKASATHLNNGTISVTNHNLSITQTGTDPTFNNTGVFEVDGNSNLTITGGIFNYTSGMLDFYGKLIINAATLNLIPEYTNTIHLTLNSSMLNCTETFTNQSDLTISGSTINGTESFINQDTMSVNGVEFSMDFENMGMATFSGNVDMNDTIITHPNSRLDISSYTGGAIDFTSEHGFTNNGILKILQYNYWGGGLVSVYSGNLTNSKTGSMEILVLGTLSSAASPFTMAALLDNKGEVLVDHHSVLNQTGITHINDGILTVKDHTLTINQVGTVFNNRESGMINGNGILTFTDATLMNSGIINPGLSPGILTINTDLAQEESSQINIELAGINPGDLYDQLIVSGAATLNGQLNIHLLEDYNPSPGDVFNIMSYSSVDGNFTDSSGFYPGTGIIFNLEQTATNLNLVTSAHDNSPPHILNPLSDIQKDEDFELFTIADLDTIFDDVDNSLGDILEYSFTLLDGDMEVSLSAQELQVGSVENYNGMATVVVTATDAGLEVAHDTFIVNIMPANDPPSLAEGVAGKWVLSLEEDFADVAIADLDTLFTDIDFPDGDELSFDYFQKSSLLSVIMEGSVLTLQSNLNAFGTDTLILSATDNGLLSINDTVIINISGINDAPESFSLVFPADGSTIDESETIYFEWEESVDVDEDVIDYTLHISSSAWDTSIAEISGTSFTLTNASSLASNTSHEWLVTSSDGLLETTSDETFTFTTPEALGIQTENAITGIELSQNYPNPFVNSTYIDFTIPNTGRVAIKIYDMTGKPVHTLLNEERPAGKYSEQLDFSNYSIGVYFYKLETESQSLVKKMAKIK